MSHNEVFIINDKVSSPTNKYTSEIIKNHSDYIM